MGLAVFPLLLEKGKKYYPVDEVVTRLEGAQPEPSTVARTRQKRGTHRCLLERAGPLALSACVTVRANERDTERPVLEAGPQNSIAPTSAKLKIWRGKPRYSALPFPKPKIPSAKKLNLVADCRDIARRLNHSTNLLINKILVANKGKIGLPLGLHKQNFWPQYISSN